MADKMMRVAGRGDDGTAKAVSTDENGRLVTKATVTRNAFTSGPLNAGTSIEIGPLSSEGYPFAQLNIKFSNKRRLRLSKKDDGQSYEIVGEAVGNYVFQYPIMGTYYYLKIENVDTSGGYLSYSKENLISAPMQKPTSRIASTRINFPDVTAGSYQRVAFSAPYGKTYDILYITARAKTTGTGTIDLNMTLNEANLYSEMFKLVGSNIDLNVSDFGASNNSAIEIPSKFNPGEVFELQRYIREIANVPESPSANYFKLGNNSNVTVTDAVVEVYYIERTV